MESYLRFRTCNSSAIFSASQHGNPQGIHGRRLLRDQPHLGIDVLRQLRDVFGIGAPKMIGLIVNFYPDVAAVPFD